MSGLSNHMKDNTFLYKVLSDIDRKVFIAYNVRYCTYEEKEIFVVVVSDGTDKHIDKYWSDIKSRCLDREVLLEYIIVTDEEYNKGVRGKFPYKLLESGYLSIDGR